MFVAIRGFLDADQVTALRKRFAKLSFIDGKSTAGWNAKLVKQNEQADPKDPDTRALAEEIAGRLGKDGKFAVAARPSRIGPILFSRHKKGMEYGPHVDDAVMAGGRTDVSFTLFMSDPDSYGGGELVLSHAGAERAVKLDAGDLFVYPSTTLHRVAKVTKGERLAVVGWATSQIRDAAKREILYDIAEARRHIFETEGKSDAFDRLSRSFSNLSRMWLE